MKRRTFLTQTSSMAAAGVVFASLPGCKTLSTAGGDPLLVDTDVGKVRGKDDKGTHAFLGIPYGASTAGKARFLPPSKVQPWTGVREAVAFGNRAPQTPMPANLPPEVKQLFRFASEPMSEDCLVLNVWTPAGNRQAKRPVMFWCHGGGFATGSGQEPDYHGANLARENDVVVVTVNHRLNVLGYMFLGDVVGGPYATGNAGMLDLVLALEWVRTNIANFGGDPGNVTIFGQSGGGAKVSALLAMPAARGLFHKAIVMSGPGLKVTPRETATKSAESAFKKLGLSKDDLAKLQEIPADQLVSLGGGMGMTGGGLTFSPVVDGVSLPTHPWEPVAPEVSANVPIMIGSTKDEMTSLLMSDPKYGKLTDAELRQRVGFMLGPKNVDQLVQFYRKLHPNHTPTDLLVDIVTGHYTTISSIQLAERKFAQGKAPVYVYMVTWETPVLGGKMRSPHGVDLPLVFANTDIAAGLVGDGPDARQMADMMSKSFAAFARNGNPNCRVVPQWPAYSPDTRSTLHFNVPPALVSDPNKDERLFWASL
jgi:para-nitrobenzyl esterase